MNFEIGDLVAFSYFAEPRQQVRDVKAMRQRTQSGQSIWKKQENKPDNHDKYPQVLILHPEWQGNVHGINLNQMSQHEINFLTALVDPFFAKEIVKKDMRIRNELQRIPQDIHITSPHDFYLRIVKPFIKLYDGYRLYKPSKMRNIRVIKPYRDIEKRLKSSQKPATTDQKEKPSSVVDTSTQQGSSFFDKYRQTLGRMRGPRFGK